MITGIEFDRNPIIAGETRSLVVYASAPIRIRISCFVFKPPPPDYRPCDACGVLTVNSGEPAKIKADEATFAHEGGELHLHIIDADGEEKEIRRKVQPLLVQLTNNVADFEAAER
jgi:hypothetical protein